MKTNFLQRLQSGYYNGANFGSTTKERAAGHAIKEDRALFSQFENDLRESENCSCEMHNLVFPYACAKLSLGLEKVGSEYKELVFLARAVYNLRIQNSK